MKKITKEFIKENLTKNGVLKNNYKKIFNKTPEELYCILNDITEQPKCQCSKVRKFRTFKEGYNKYCSLKCANKYKWTDEAKENGVKARKEYYEEHPDELELKNKKISETNKKVWASGTELRIEQTKKLKDALNTGIPQLKQKETKEKRYNNPNYNNIEKMQETCYERYGVDNPRQISGMTKRIEETFIEKYGYKNTFCDPNIRKKALESKNRKYLENTNLKDKELYYFYVLKITKEQDIEKLNNFHKRGRAGTKGAYHLDHKYSIIEGFRNNIPPYIIGNINNLEMIPAKENISKQGKCSIEINEIMHKILNKGDSNED